MTLAELKQTPGITTADKISQPARKRQKGPFEGWGVTKKLAFKAMAPAGLSLVATDGPCSMTLWNPDGSVARRIGHNRGVWPARIARTNATRDTATATYDKGPLLPVETKFRVWCGSTEMRNLLAASVVDLMAKRQEDDGGIEPLTAEWYDLGPDLDLSMFELEVHDIGKRLRIPTFDDYGLSAFLDEIVIRAHEAIQTKGGTLTDKRLERIVDSALLADGAG